MTSTGWAPLRTSRRPRTPNEEAFLRLALNHTLAMAGDAMVTVALAGSIFFTTTPSAARVKVIFALLLTMAPFAVVAPFLGPAIDRSKGGRRLMLVGTAAGRALICVYMATVVHSVLLYPCALGVLILSKAHAVAKSSLVPATVDNPADLVRAGSRLAVLAAIAGFAAGGPAAVILKLGGAAWVLRVAAVVYTGALAMAARTRPAPPAELAPPDHVDEAVRSRGVSLAAWCRLTIRACSGFLTFAVAFIFRRGHHVFDAATGRTVRHEVPQWWYGVVVMLALAGGFLGSLLGPRVRKVLGEERMLTAALVTMAAVALLAARMDSRPGLALLALCTGLANGIGQLAFDAIVQRDGSEGSRGRSFARYEATFQLAWVGAALLPVIIPIANWLACLAIAAGTGTAATFYAVGRRSLRSARLRPVPTAVAPGGGAARPVVPGEEGPGVWAAVRDVSDPYPTPPMGTAPAREVPRPPAREQRVPGPAWQPAADIPTDQPPDEGGARPPARPRRNPRRAERRGP